MLWLLKIHLLYRHLKFWLPRNCYGRVENNDTFPIEITDLHIICLAVVICLGHSAQPGEGMWYQGVQYFLKFFTLLVPSWKVFTILKHKTFVLHFPNQSFPLVKIRVLFKQVPGLATVQYSFWRVLESMNRMSFI